MMSTNFFVLAYLLYRMNKWSRSRIRYLGIGKLSLAVVFCWVLGLIAEQEHEVNGLKGLFNCIARHGRYTPI